MAFSEMSVTNNEAGKKDVRKEKNRRQRLAGLPRGDLGKARRQQAEAFIMRDVLSGPKRFLAQKSRQASAAPMQCV